MKIESGWVGSERKKRIIGRGGRRGSQGETAESDTF